MKNYTIKDTPISYETVNEKDVFYLIKAARNGIGYSRFAALAKAFPFTASDWSVFLHLSERTLQRYQKEEKAFDPVSSERIIEITLLYKQSVKVFGSRKKLDIWLGDENLALGGSKPKDLLDSTLGVQLVRNELQRIEYGILS
ncbi:MAG: antitoxin Xre/MbcA/ParS toxin-binding domain-containing protein [Bacteroidota bacterium]